MVALGVDRLVLTDLNETDVSRNTSSSISVPKAVAMAIGLFLAIALAVEAPVESASPSTAAERIRDAHKKGGHEPQDGRHTGRRHGGHQDD